MRSLHRLLEQADELRSRLVRGPRVLAAADIELEKIRVELSAAQDLHRRAQLSSNEKQVQLTQREARVEDLGVKLNMATKNAEYQAIKDQIAADKVANAVLSDEILGTARTGSMISPVKSPRSKNVLPRRTPIGPNWTLIL